MKQHIKLEQLRELDDKTFMKLYKLIRPNGIKASKRILDIKNSKYIGLNKLLSEINIGKMIEILNIDWGVTVYTGLEKSMVKLGKGFKDGVEHEEKELCDALWELLKYVGKEI
jgi:hypothetical protein